MRIAFNGRGVAVSETFADYAEGRLEKLSRLNHKVTGVHVVLSQERGRADVEITADLDGDLVRSEVKGPDDRASFDAALEKLERQILKYKARWDKRRRPTREEAAAAEPAPEVEEEDEAPDSEEPRIVRTKSVSLKPMAPEEAALQMELLGHDFFLFRNADTDLVAVVYRRRDAGYGLLECEA